MARIHLLPDHLISQIAAGEVVERPASVVKELVENALDAGATEIQVDLESGGKRRIVVRDDGSGLGADDTLLAFDRHATSKISSFDDLERVGTLGFRGEALASIAAVARVELQSAEQPGDGHRVRIEGGRVKTVEPAAHPRGTTLEVASLFFNVPARRKFLKTPATEQRRCVEVVQGYALSRPDVRFTVRSEGRALLEALPVVDGKEGARQRIGQIFGSALARELAPIPEPAEGGATNQGELPRIHGFVGSPETTQGRRLFVFVNRRLLRDRAVLATFYRAVRETWRKDDYPALFLFLDLPPEDVDVNVHPQKAEVRFRNSGLLDEVLERLRQALEQAMGEVEAPLREPIGAPLAPLAWQGLGAARPGAAQPGAAQPEDGDLPYATGTVPASDVADPGGREGFSAPFGSGYGALRGSGRQDGPGQEDLPAVWRDDARGRGTGTSDASGHLGQDRVATPSLAPAQRPIVPLSGRSGEARPFRLLGQYKGTLILLEGPDGLYLIDQHVAHERLLYERLRREMLRESTPSQRLVTPMLLELAPTEHLRLAELTPRLQECGFALEPLSGNTLGLQGIPAVLSQDEAERLLLKLAATESGSADDGDGGDDSVAALRLHILDALAASLSCRNAVKMHHPLRAQEMEVLVAELFAAENPFACPHGRPIVLQMTDSDLERRFGRR